jgi:hypothetical protein
MIHEHLEVEIPQQVKIYFVTVISYRHYVRPFLIKFTYPLLKRKPVIFNPRDHEINLCKKYPHFNID